MEKIYNIKLDFNKLSEYKWDSSSEKNLPITSLIKLYQACDIYDIVEEYKNKYSKTFASIDILSCNFYTLQHLKRFIEENWKHYNISIDADEHIFWKSKNKEWHKYENKLSSKLVRSIADNYTQYCPYLNDELEDDVIKIEFPEEDILEKEA